MEYFHILSDFFSRKKTLILLYNGKSGCNYFFSKILLALAYLTVDPNRNLRDIGC